MTAVWIVFRAQPFGFGQVIVAVFLEQDKDVAVGMAAASSIWMRAERFEVTDPAAVIAELAR